MALYLLYLVRKPLSWLVLATFLAVAASGPVNALNRRMPRGAAIADGLPGDRDHAGSDRGDPHRARPWSRECRLANDLPDYVQDLNEAFEENDRLRRLNEDYDITTKLEDASKDLIARLGDAAGTLADIGAGIVSSLFAVITILVMSMFMVSRGRQWRDAALVHRPPDRGRADPARHGPDRRGRGQLRGRRARSRRRSPALPRSSCS